MFFKKKPHKTREGRLVLTLQSHNIDLFFDVGANIGQTGQSLRKHGYKGKIVSFEPLSSARAKLLKASQNDPDWIVAPAMALSDAEGSVEMLVSEATDMSSMAAPLPDLLTAIPRTKEVARESVTMARLDKVATEWLSGARNAFLKIDAQGNDLKVLQGATGIIDKIRGVEVEMSLLPLYESEPDYREICGWLHERGFIPYLMQERTFSRKLTRQLQIDGVFFK